VGIDVAIQERDATIMLIEGTGDFLAGWDIRGLGYQVAPVGIWGANNSIAVRGLAIFFERREVVIVQQHDAAAAIAAERWRQQLQTVHARQRVWVVPAEGEDLNNYVTAGEDVAAIFH